MGYDARRGTDVNAPLLSSARVERTSGVEVCETDGVLAPLCFRDDGRDEREKDAHSGDVYTTPKSLSTQNGHVADSEMRSMGVKSDGGVDESEVERGGRGGRGGRGAGVDDDDGGSVLARSIEELLGLTG